MGHGGDRRARFPLLTPGQARGSLAARLARVADRAGQLEVRFGLRPYVVELVWSKWSGDERGDGRQSVVCRMPILPVPRVADLTALSRQPMAAGAFPVGSIRVDRISAEYRRDFLEGRVIPTTPEVEVPEPYDFWWEVTEDGRHGGCELRRRFRLASEPFLDAENQQWVVILEKQSSDAGRDGKPIDDPVPDALPNPALGQLLPRPSDDD